MVEALVEIAKIFWGDVLPGNISLENPDVFECEVWIIICLPKSSVRILETS